MLRIAIKTITLTISVAAAALAQDPHNFQTSSRTYGARPALFVPNKGQAPADVLWQAIGAGFEASFRRDGFALSIPSGVQVSAPEALRYTPTNASAVSGGTGNTARPITMVEQRIFFVGASAQTTVEPLDPQPGKFSFFRGRDRSKWAAGLSTYSRLRYHNLYPGIDLVFYSQAGSLEYDFVVAPGGDPSLIRLRVGDSPAHITPQGALQVGDGTEAVLHRPLLYQNLEHGKQAVEGKFVLLAGGAIGFRFSSYDRRKTLVIDPTLSLLYSTYLGGYHDDEATAIALDSQNNAYVLGFSESPNYPVSGNAYQPARGNLAAFITNVVVTKMSPSGTILFSTFVGGSNNDTSGGLVLDSNGNAYFTGMTKSTDFPVTANAYQNTFTNGASTSAFLSELSPDGSALLYSTFFGGSGGASGASIAMNPQNNLVIAGSAGPGLTTSSTAYLQTISTGNAAFIAIFNPTLSGSAQLVASSYYGASTPIANYSGAGNLALAMALDSTGNPWITGQTFTNNLPLKNAYQTAAALPTLSASCQTNGAALNSAAYLASLSANLSTLNYASYVTGTTIGSSVDACSEYGHAIALDSSGNVYVAGTTSSATFPVTASVPQGSYPGTSGYVDFVAKFGSGGTALTWSTYLGGNGGNSFMDALLLDGQGDVWISGTTQGGTNFPLVNAYQGMLLGTYNGNITEFSNDGTKVLYSTYLGGNGSDVAIDFALDSLDNVYVAGYTTSTNFPVTSNAFEPKKADGGPDYNGNDIFFTILGSGAIGVVNPSSGGNTGDTTITVSGAGFQAGAACSLVQGATTITGTVLSVSSSGNSITCNFNLNGASTGVYNVAVTNPGGSPLVTANAFTVVSGGQPQIWANIAGRSVLRVGFPSNFYIIYGNSGSVDAYFTVLWIAFPSQLSYKVLATVQPVLGNASDQSLPGLTDPTSGTTYLGFVLPHLPAGSSYTLPIQFNDPNLDPALPLVVYMRPPWFDSATTAVAALSSAQASPSSLSAVCVVPSTKPYLNNCLGDLAFNTAVSVVQIPDDDLVSPPVPIPAQYASDANSAISQVGSLLLDALDTNVNIVNLVQLYGKVAQNIPAISAVLNGRDCVENASEIGTGVFNNELWIDLQYSYCNGSSDSRWELDEPGPRREPPSSGTSGAAPLAIRAGAHPRNLDDECHGDYLDALADLEAAEEGGYEEESCSSTGGSHDPNDKNGPFGDGSAAHYVQLVPLTYNIAFENQATATLPAAQVVITDQLDPTKVNLASVTLGPIAFGTTILTPPPATNNYETTVSVNSSLSVRIQGSLNADTGLLKWTYTSIDPSTGLPPTDPTVGFLPPDTNGVEGQGAVVFSVSPKSTLTTGTQISNQATIVFDVNAPINTPTWLNTIDVTPPVSSVTPLSANQSKTCFTVAWSGTDLGSGIANYAIYVSDNGGPFTLWQTSTSASSATYTGQAGHTYGFYSIASDGAGNKETKTVADTVTSVKANASGCVAYSTTTTITVSPDPAVYDQPVTITATVSNGTATPPNGGNVTFMAGSVTLGVVTLSNGQASYTTTVGQLQPVEQYHTTASFGGNSQNAASSPSKFVDLLVNPATTTTLLTSSVNPAVPHETVIFTATVSPAFQGTPTGTVTFYNGSSVLQTVSLVNGVATYSTTSLAAGARKIKATYNGSLGFKTSSGSLTEEIY